MYHHSNIILPASHGVLLEAGVEVSFLGRPTDGSENPGAPNGDPHYLERLRNLRLESQIIYLNCDHSGRINCVGFGRLNGRYTPIDDLVVNGSGIITIPGDALVFDLNHLPSQALRPLAPVLRTWDCGKLFIYNWLTKILAMVHVSVKTGYGYGCADGEFPGPILDAVIKLCGPRQALHFVWGPMITGQASRHQDVCPYEFDPPHAQQLFKSYSSLYPAVTADQHFQPRDSKTDINFGQLILESLGSLPDDHCDRSAMFCTMHPPEDHPLYCNRLTRLAMVNPNLTQAERDFWAKRNIERNGNLLVARF